MESGASASSAPGLSLVHLEHLLLVCLPNLTLAKLNHIMV